MAGRIVPVEVFEKWLGKEYRKQKARTEGNHNTVAKYRAYAVGNAWAIFKRDTAALVGADEVLTKDYYRKFRQMVAKNSTTNASTGTNEGYSIVLRMLNRSGVQF